MLGFPEISGEVGLDGNVSTRENNIACCLNLLCFASEVMFRLVNTQNKKVPVAVKDQGGIEQSKLLSVQI